MDSESLIQSRNSEIQQWEGSPAPSPYLPPAPQEASLGDYWRILVKRKWTVLACLAVVLTLATLVTLRMTPEYEAVSRIAIFRENTEILNFKDVGSMTSEDWDYTIGLETQVKILQSDSIALQVLRNLDARNAGGAIALGTQPQAASQQESAHLGRFRSSLKISTIPNTRMIEVRYLDPDPNRAAQIVNTLAATYIEQNFKTKYESTMQASEWLRQQLADLQIKVETSQERLVKYQRENEILGIDEKQNITTAKLDELNRQLTAAEAERIQKEAAFRQAQGGKPELTGGNTGLLEKLRNQEADLRTKLAQLSAQFGPAYPAVIETSNQLKETQSAIAAESGKIGERVERDFQTAVSRERMLRSALEAQKREANLLNERAIQYNLLKRDVESNRELYEGLLQKLKEAGVSAGLKSSNIRVVDAARVPTSPAKPDVPRNLALALLLGLSGGVALAFMLEMMDNTLRTPEQVQYVSALPSLGLIPMGTKQLSAKQQRAARPKLALTAAAGSRREVVELVAYARPKSEIAESYRALRTSILLSSLGAPPKVILVTSALPQEGKTTTSINTAIVLAQKGARVLLVDADLRRPSIHHKMGMKSRAGLSTVLAGSDTFEAAVLPSSQLPNLFVLPAGPPPPHPAELLGSALMKSYLAKWREEFDHVIIDTPPSLSVTDAVLLSVDVDSVILVIRSGQTTKEALRRARDLLVQVKARVMGVVVNAVDLQSPDLHYYYYGSKYGGHYYEESTRN